MRVYDEASNVIETHEQGRFQRVVEPLSRNFFEYHAEAGVVDYRCPTVRLRKCEDFFLTRCTRCTFYLFGRPTRFKLTLEDHAVFPLLDALSNEFGELVLRVRSAGFFLKHVLGGNNPLLKHKRFHITVVLRKFPIEVHQELC